MIQDFAHSFDGKQSIHFKVARSRTDDKSRKVVGIVLTCAMLIGLLACIIFGLLIRSGLAELSQKKVVKVELIRQQQELFAQRNELLTQKNIEKVAGVMGLFTPSTRQVKQL